MRDLVIVAFASTVGAVMGVAVLLHADLFGGRVFMALLVGLVAAGAVLAVAWVLRTVTIVVEPSSPLRRRETRNRRPHDDAPVRRQGGES